MIYGQSLQPSGDGDRHPAYRRRGFPATGASWQPVQSFLSTGSVHSGDWCFSVTGSQYRAFCLSVLCVMATGVSKRLGLSCYRRFTATAASGNRRSHVLFCRLERLAVLCFRSDIRFIGGVDRRCLLPTESGFPIPEATPSAESDFPRRKRLSAPEATPWAGCDSLGRMRLPAPETTPGAGRDSLGRIRLPAPEATPGAGREYRRWKRTQAPEATP